MPKILDLETDFDVFMGDVILLPPETVFFRGQDPKYPAISNRPAQFGSLDTAEGYAPPRTNKIIGAFITSRPLYLIDIRYLKAILKLILDKKSQENNNLTISEQYAVVSLTLSFGLSSLGHQIKLIDNLTNTTQKDLPGVRRMKAIQNPKRLLEQPGVRIAETTNDIDTMAILKGLFKNVIDGFFSPRLESIFHFEKNGYMSPEVIIFNPQASGIKPFHNLLHPFEYISMKSIIDEKQHQLRINPSIYKIPFHLQGGSIDDEPIKQKHFLDELEEKINKKDKKIIQKYNDGLRIGEKWAKKYMGSLNDIFFFEPPVPTFQMDFSNLANFGK